MPRILDIQTIDDPSVSDANYREWLASKNEARVKTRVAVNLSETIGGLARVRKRQPQHDRAAKNLRDPHHDEAARLFKSRYEALYGGMAPAVDPSVTPVDTSKRAHDAGMAGRVDAGTSIREAIHHLGKADADLIIAVVVLGCSTRDMGFRGRAASAVMTRLLLALDRLAGHWGLLFGER